MLDPFAGTLAANAIQVDNAVRHTRQGRLCFTYRGGSPRIEDTGIGIPPEALTHVFERFYRAPPGNVDRGFGIGLAIVKRICDRYHWAIEIDSAVGRGTCVALGIPPVG